MNADKRGSEEAQNRSSPRQIGMIAIRWGDWRGRGVDQDLTADDTDYTDFRR